MEDYMNENLVERFTALQEKAQKHREEVARLAGKQDQLIKQLKEFGVDTLEEAEAKLEIIQRDIAKREKRVEKLMAEIEDAVKDLPND